MKASAGVLVPTAARAFPPATCACYFQFVSKLRGRHHCILIIQACHQHCLVHCFTSNSMSLRVAVQGNGSPSWRPALLVNLFTTSTAVFLGGKAHPVPISCTGLPMPSFFIQHHQIFRPGSACKEDCSRQAIAAGNKLSLLAPASREAPDCCW